jgi:hypothetical protein
MNDKKIAFIIAVNNEQYFEECCFYIHRLSVPAGYDIDIIAIREADSMCAAYNAGMNNSDAKYKVYMHQDVMIRNVQFIENIIKIFKQNLKKLLPKQEAELEQGILLGDTSDIESDIKDDFRNESPFTRGINQRSRNRYMVSERWRLCRKRPSDCRG